MNAYDKSKWSTSGESILAGAKLAAIKIFLEANGHIAVEHWHYYGAKAPTPLAFNDFEEFMKYLRSEVRPGDAIDVYPFPSNAESAIAKGKYPDEEGRVPEGGAY
jgi:hypothetical protein